MDLKPILDLIYQFGVLPILLVVVWYLHKKVNKLTKQNDTLNEEIRSVEKENVALLYKVLSAVKKIKGGDSNE